MLHFDRLGLHHYKVIAWIFLQMDFQVQMTYKSMIYQFLVCTFLFTEDKPQVLYICENLISRASRW